VYVIKTLPEFDVWLQGLKDRTAQRRMVVNRKKIKASGLPEFDPAEYLDSDEAVAGYLTEVLSENDLART
jgi:hypothetical protein